MFENMREMIFGKRKKDKVKDMVTGALVGGVAGILLAPKSGKETREDILNKSKEISENIKSTMEEKVEDAKDFKEKVASDISENIEEMKETKDKITKDIADGYSDIKATVKDTKDDIKKNT